MGVVMDLRGLNSDLSSSVARGREALVRIEKGRRGAGAGTVWHERGLILTGAHVARAGGLRVVLPDGRMTPGLVNAMDDFNDLVALSVEEDGLTTIPLGSTEHLKPGDWVLALGHPWGVSGVATAGVVIGKGIPLELSRQPTALIQVSLHHRPGHSGGPLLDAAGRLVGISTMMAGLDVGLAIPVETAVAFLKENLNEFTRPRAVSMDRPSIRTL
jgi:serine protease Do